MKLVVGKTVHLQTRNGSRSSLTLDESQNPNDMDLRETPMKVVAQQEDLEFLGKVLRNSLCDTISSCELFEVKCAVKNDQLMVLVEHPEAVTAGTQDIFTVLTTTLQSLPTHKEQQVEIFLRITGTRFPYTKHSLTLKPSSQGSREWIPGNKEHENNITSGYYSPPPSSSLLVIPDSSLAEETPFDPFVDVTDLSTDKSTNKSNSERKFAPVFLAAVFFVATTFGGGGYFLSRPCMMFECQEIQTAEELQRTLKTSLNNVRSEQDLIQLQQQLNTSASELQSIPSWSPRHQDASSILSKIAQNNEQISKVLKAFKIGNNALNTTSQGRDVRDLEARQQLWRQAIVPLETIPQNSELYGLAQQQLSLYRLRLQNVNQMLSTEDRWLKKLTSAKAVAKEAAKRETTAQSLQDWQIVQSTWQVVVNALTPIPQNSVAYPEAQNLLAEYQPKLARVREHTTREILASRAYNQAVNTAAKAKRYEEQNQWSAAANYWQQALSLAKSVTSDNPYFTQAQALIESYTNSLNQLKVKLQSQSTSLETTRADLERTCSGTVRICNFIINQQGITVRITAAYEQSIKDTLADASVTGNPEAVNGVTKHLKVLQEAFEVIGENANLPIVVYDGQGIAIYQRS